MSLARWDRGSLACGALLVAAICLLAGSMALARRMATSPLDGEPMPAPGAAASPAAETFAIPRDSLLATMRLAVSVDPFQATRSAPAERYVPPPERARRRALEGRAERRKGIRLVGTVVLESGHGLAAVKMPGAPVRLLRPGDSLAGLELVHIERGRARLAATDTTLDLSVETPRAEGDQP